MREGRSSEPATEDAMPVKSPRSVEETLALKSRNSRIEQE